MAIRKVGHLTEGAAPPIGEARVRLTSAQLRALHTAAGAIALTDAPGAGKLIVLDDAVATFTPAAASPVAYAGGGPVLIQYAASTPLTIVQFTANTLTGGTTATTRHIRPAVAQSEPRVGAALRISTGTAFTAGNGTLEVVARYRIVDLNVG